MDMAKKRRPKVIQVPIDPDLLTRVDEGASMVAESRAAFIREACRRRLRSLEREKLERRYVEGYERSPEDTAWARMGAVLLSRVLPKEKW